MRLSLVSWNSLNINDGNPLKAVIPPGQMANTSANPVTVDRAGDYPFLSTTVLNAHVLTIEVYVAAGQNINQARETLKGYFNVGDKQRHNLIAYDRDDSNRAYYMTGFPIGVQAMSGSEINAFVVRIQVEYGYWQQVTASVDSWDITASGDSDAILNAGNIPVPPIFTITPTTTKTAGLKYRRYVTLYNNMDKSFVEPLDITSGGLDVQSLIDAGKMQADGDDFRVWEDGAFRDRWLSGMDSDSDPAKCWTNEYLSPRHEGATSATFDSDDTTISLSATRANLAFLRALKLMSNKSFLIDSEVVGYADSDIDLIGYSISNLTRGQKDTTAVSHSASSTVRHLEHDLWILYGDSDLGAPDVDDDFKPLFDLTSTNQVWDYSNFFYSVSARPGAWKGEVLSTKTGLSYVFTDSDPTTIADPSNVLGLAMIGTQSSNQPLNESSVLDWLFSHPAGITDVDYSGKVYSLYTWPAVAGLQYLLPNTTWVTAQNETAPTVSSAWQTITPHSVSLGGTYETIRFALDGSLSTTPGDRAMAAFNTVSLTFDSDNLPTVSVGAENPINFFEFTLTNNTTGEYIKVQCPCPVNTALTIDCEAKRAYLADGTRVNVILSSDRPDWLNLNPGTNNLQYVDAGTVAVHVNITHRDRVL